jgi:hypothetical protein
MMEKGRIRLGYYGSDRSACCNGAFKIGSLAIIASDGNDKVAEGFEHVSVSCEDRTPTWEEMHWVKQQFWTDDEVCYQLHPAKTNYINCHPHCLHIWRHQLFPVPMPPSLLIGFKS